MDEVVANVLSAQMAAQIYLEFGRSRCIRHISLQIKLKLFYGHVEYVKYLYKSRKKWPDKEV
ncbi:hypothetical protein GPEL0_01r1325 [Geoanaerobacter pelophilus]|uniref:Uncharacterized protein n=1 Tax=Geoanaerobacter pelophilus TaxID=60036 RepID=A0ABQ0MGQ0_9BACT|nr:hypothetical protein GPEL0_01r1325 [Geoanaerobacter pelophilus]